MSWRGCLGTGLDPPPEAFSYIWRWPASLLVQGTGFQTTSRVSDESHCEYWTKVRLADQERLSRSAPSCSFTFGAQPGIATLASLISASGPLSFKF